MRCFIAAFLQLDCRLHRDKLYRVCFNSIKCAWAVRIWLCDKWFGDMTTTTAAWEEVLNRDGKQSSWRAKRGMGMENMWQRDNIVFLTGEERGEQTKITTEWEMEGGGSKRRDDRWMDGWKELAWSERAPRWGILGNPLNHRAPFPD